MRSRSGRLSASCRVEQAGGVVAGVGPGVTSLRVGQRVSIEPGVPCRSCAQCLAGRYNLCPDVRFFATPPYDGVFNEYVAMPAAFVHSIPAGHQRRRSGSARAALGRGLGLSTRGGRSMGGDEVRLPLSYVQDRELVVTGAFRYANTWPTAINLAAAGRVDLDAVVTGHYGLADVESALTAARSDPTVLKAIVRPRS